MANLEDQISDNWNAPDTPEPTQDHVKQLADVNSGVSDDIDFLPTQNMPGDGGGLRKCEEAISGLPEMSNQEPLHNDEIIVLPSMTSSEEEEESLSDMQQDENMVLDEDFGSSSDDSDSEFSDDPDTVQTLTKKKTQDFGKIVFSFAPPKTKVKKFNDDICRNIGAPPMAGEVHSPMLPILQERLGFQDMPSQPSFSANASYLNMGYLENLTLQRRASTGARNGYHIAYLISLPLQDKEGNSIVPLELKKEVGKVKDMLSRCGKKIRFRSAIGTIQSFIDILMAGTNILHISCHGSREGVMGFEADTLPTDDTNRNPNFDVDEFIDILRTVDQCMLPEVIFLAACYSESLGKKIHKKLNGKIKHIICIRETQPVKDQAVLLFAPLFYQTIISGQKVMTAYYMARNMVLERHGEQEAEKFRLLPLKDNGEDPDPRAHNEVLFFTNTLEEADQEARFLDFTTACDVNFGLTEGAICGRNLQIVEAINLIQEHKTVLCQSKRDVGTSWWLRHVMERIRMRHLAGITSILYIQLSYDQPDLQFAFERALEKIWSIKNLRKQDRYRAIRELIMDAPNLVGERIHKLASDSDFPEIRRENAEHQNCLLVLDGMHWVFENLSDDQRVSEEQTMRNWQCIQRFLQAGDCLKIFMTTSGSTLVDQWSRRTNSPNEFMQLDPLRDDFMLEIFHKSTQRKFLTLIFETDEMYRKRKKQMEDIIKLFKGRPNLIRLMSRYIMDKEYSENWDNFVNYMQIPDLIDNFLKDRDSHSMWKQRLRSLGLGRYILDFNAKHCYDMQIWPIIQQQQLIDMGMTMADVMVFKRSFAEDGLQLNKASSVEEMGLDDLLDELETVLRIRWMRDKSNESFLERAKAIRGRVREVASEYLDPDKLQMVVQTYRRLSEGDLGEKIIENRLELIHFGWMLCQQTGEGLEEVTSNANSILTKEGYGDHPEANLIMAEVLVYTMNETDNFDEDIEQAEACMFIAAAAYPDTRRVIIVQVEIYEIYGEWDQAYNVIDNFCQNNPKDWKAKLRLAKLQEGHPDQDPTQWAFAVKACDRIIHSEQTDTPAEVDMILEAISLKAQGFLFRCDYANAILNTKQAMEYQEKNGFEPDADLHYNLASSYFCLIQPLIDAGEFWGEIETHFEEAHLHWQRFETMMPDDLRLAGKKQFDAKRIQFYDIRSDIKPDDLKPQSNFGIQITDFDNASMDQVHE